MSRYTVNATISHAAWVDVEADTPAEALENARDLSADRYDYDTGSAAIEFNVEPAVELRND